MSLSADGIRWQTGKSLPMKNWKIIHICPLNRGNIIPFIFPRKFFRFQSERKISESETGQHFFNLLIGLNGYTVCSGVIDENLNGKDIIAVPLADENEMKIGYIVHQKNRISRLGTTYLKALEKYLDPKEEPGRECLHMRQE